MSDIVAQLERSLELLASDLQDTPERHRSIRAVFEQSWQQEVVLASVPDSCLYHDLSPARSLRIGQFGRASP